MARLSRTPPPSGGAWDLVVVGGGIMGVCVAFEAVRRGLATLLLEADDFGGGTSWNSMRILHGGLRYLQRGDLGRFRESVRDRRWFQRAFPELTRPQSVLLPLSGEGLRRPGVLRAALAVNDVLGRGRNRGVDPRVHLPGGSFVDRETVRRAVPLSAELPVTGGALWWDARADPPQRLLMEILLRAVAEGAHAWSRSRVVGVARRRAGLEVAVEGTGRGAARTIRCERLAVCVGPEAPAIEGVVAERPDGAPPAGAAFNVVLRKPLPSRYGVALELPGDRTVFAYPLGELTLAGTVHGEGGWTAASAPSDAEVSHFVGELSGGFAGWDVGAPDVARVLWGALPCRTVGSAEQGSRPWLLDVDGLGPSAVVVVGIKYTTAPSLARRVLDRWAPASGPASPPRAASVLEVPGPRAFLDRAAANPEAASALLGRLSAEGCETLDDVLLRRTDWALDPEVGEEVGACVRALGHVHP